MSTMTLALDRAGLDIDERRFAKLVADAVHELAPAGSADPAAELSAADAEALRAVGADLTPRRRREPDPRAEGAAAGVALLATALTVPEAAGRLGIDDSRVRHRLAAGALLGLKRGRSWVLPAWQFAPDGGVLPGLGEVAPALRALPALVAAGFATTPQPELRVRGRARSPRDWLLAGGDPAPVAQLAAALGEQF